jgi:uncharacterized ion transporter superfamily protein YfcC
MVYILWQEYKRKRIFIIFIIMVLKSIGGATFGIAEETLGFYPILIAFFKKWLRWIFWGYFLN